MPEFQRYRVTTETLVVVESVLLSGGELPVGEYVVRASFGGAPTTHKPEDISALVEQAMAKASKSAKTMAAGVVNTERNRLK